MKLWIARDKDNTLTLFKCKPVCDEDGDWCSESGYFSGLPSFYFTEVTFKNSPQKVKIELVRNETRG